ncbi:hypothetical protein [Vogesella sp. XCS3]|uniref:hypothetical protein n=1 Tax=Vogesella sp. XCS3 TaxID=2877939 RepID=UPI001D0A94B4|nr:hypothetical protein [Vogesella sp. XCS3]UDM15862.1 hypothetical protein LCH97_11140 [Vogesella sp. XCS3]
MNEELQVFQIFRPGTFTSMSGTRLSFSEQDLELMVSAFNPARRPAPLVLGHPKDDLPAFGQVRGLFMKDGNLYAQAQVSPALVELVRTGRAKNVSASFLTPYVDENPVSGAYYLKHVGFLGAQPPAVKGMAPLAFAEAEGAICFAQGLGMTEGNAQALQFAEGCTADPERMRLHRLALAHQRACPSLSYSEAIRHAKTITF